MFRIVSLSNIRSFSLNAQQWYMSYMFADSFASKLYDIYHWCVYLEKTPDDGKRNCPKHAVFKSKNKFEKLVHLVGFILDPVLLLGLFLSVFTFDPSICLPYLRDLHLVILVHDRVSLCRACALLNMILCIFLVVIILKFLLRC